MEAPCELLREGWLQLSPRHSTHTSACSGCSLPALLRAALGTCCWPPAPSHQGPQRTSALLQCRNQTSAAHLGKETPPTYLLSSDWAEPSSGSALVSPQGSSLGADPGTGVGITAEHRWDGAACEMPLVCKPSAVCSPCLVLNLSSLAAIPAWAPAKPGRSDTFLCPPQSRGGAGGGSGGEPAGSVGTGESSGGQVGSVGAGGILGGQAGCLHSQ